MVRVAHRLVAAKAPTAYIRISDAPGVSASANFVRFSTQGIALSASINGQGGFPAASTLSFPAISRSARYRPARKTQGRRSRSSAITAPSCSSRLSAVDQFRWNFQQLSGQGEKLLVWQAAMAIVHRLGERKRYAGTDADQRGLLNPELRCDLVGRAEADAAPERLLTPGGHRLIFAE
jgi:hypothetical protein